MFFYYVGEGMGKTFGNNCSYGNIIYTVASMTYFIFLSLHFKKRSLSYLFEDKNVFTFLYLVDGVLCPSHSFKGPWILFWHMQNRSVSPLPTPLLWCMSFINRDTILEVINWDLAHIASHKYGWWNSSM